MEAPKYLTRISEVAEHHGGLSNHDVLYSKMSACWALLENNAKNSRYDILEEFHALEPMRTMVDLLYHTPGADYRHDVRVIYDKDREYGGSWYRRGGPGAFMMLARKWDRIEAAVSKHGTAIFVSDQRVEGIQDDFGDLRRYLILVLAWHLATQDPPVQEDIPF